MNRSQISETLKQLGIPHLMSIDRNIIHQFTLSVMEIQIFHSVGSVGSGDISNSSSGGGGGGGCGLAPLVVKYHNGCPFQFFLFNDIFVFWKGLHKERSKSVAKNSDNSRSLKKCSFSQATVWPLELLWLCDQHEQDENLVQFVGPKVTIITEGLSASVKDMVFSAICDTLRRQTGKGRSPTEATREGKFTFPTSEVYDGWWEIGKFSGHGYHEFYGTYYEGEFLNNSRHGQGIMEFGDGQLYEGNFNNGLPEGYGRSITLSGDKYEGNWWKGARNEMGKLEFKNGDTYSGGWKNNLPNGIGELVLLNPKRVYKGDFVDGRFEGYGTLSTDEWTYVGSFKNGVRSGEGEFIQHAGQKTCAKIFKYSGIWEDGEFSGQGILQTPEFTYTGGFSKGKFSGKGKLDYTKGDSFEGSSPPLPLSLSFSEYFNLFYLVQDFS
eukprot:TRINITY_DN12711_c0_g1_i2.p1 TRINITY_DN12711_c0_g1~~TRINITY_DN12711_c0_g1_i2.p1  ORF type:complete len:437 (-),score=83.77 TRINITY_DN12711_c0_g1_i2:487-1797(-)